MNRKLPIIDVPQTHSSESANNGFGALKSARGLLPLTDMNVHTTIVDLIAQTKIEQVFQNSLSEPIEATYIFPLPNRAAVTRFQLRVAGRVVEGTLKERAAARSDYNQAIQAGHRAAIAEEERSGVFTIRAGNIPAGERVTVELQLTGPLPVSSGNATFRFPLVVAQRYTPGIPLDGAAVGSGTANDTDQVPDASRVTPPVLLPGFPNPIRLQFQVEIDPPSHLVNEDRLEWQNQFSSSLHSVFKENQEERFCISLIPGERLDRDFVLRFPVAQNELTASAKATVAGPGQPGTFALTVYPPAQTALSQTPRDIVFVLDRSGSMEGWNMVAARRAVGRMVDSLQEHDRFNVVAFDNTTESPNGSLVQATDRNRWQAIEWLGNIQARGGTEMSGALNAAQKMLSAHDTPASTTRCIVLVTDGQITGEDAILRQLENTNPAMRVFCVGIDQAVNGGFLERLANQFSGHCELVESPERLDEALSSIHRMIAAPVLTDVTVELVNGRLLADDLSPAKLDVFADRPAVISGRFSAEQFDKPIALRVNGKLADGSAWSANSTTTVAAPEILQPVWGRSRVRELEDRFAVSSGSAAQELMHEIVRVSLETNVLSRFTAFVAVDDAEVVNEGGRLHQITQAVEGKTRAVKRRTRTRSAGAKAKRSVSFSPPAAPPAAVPGQSFVDSFLLEDLGVDQDDDLLQEFTDTSIDFTSTPESPGAMSPDELSPIGRLIQIFISEAVQLSANKIVFARESRQIRIQFVIDGSIVESKDRMPVRFWPELIEHLHQLAADIEGSSKSSLLTKLISVLRPNAVATQQPLEVIVDPQEISAEIILTR